MLEKHRLNDSKKSYVRCRTVKVFDGSQTMLTIYFSVMPSWPFDESQAAGLTDHQILFSAGLNAVNELWN